MRQIAALLALFAATAFAQSASEWKPMFDGKSLAGWKEAPFTGRGEVRVETGTLVLGAGHPLTGVNWTGAFPQIDYEVRFEAVKQQGGDFFATLTFPYSNSFGSWVTGGWGGDIVGLSSIDGWDASENETRRYYTFETGRWYAFRLQVTADRIRGWIDEQPVLDVAIGGRAISLRPGPINLSAPFGFASYNTKGALRKIEYRLLRTAASGARSGGEQAR